MQQATLADDDLLMHLVEEAQARTGREREAYLLKECRGDAELVEQVCRHIHWKERMGAFLLQPLFTPLEEEDPFEAGQLLGNRFHILREVARGGMGIVWEALDEKLDRRVALKCAKAGFREHLPPEVRNARDVSHPNVCKIYEIHTATTEKGEVDFISMEFVEGETLSERLANQSLSKRERVTIARQLCAGVAEAHRNNIVHGDLKSNNIIVDGDVERPLRAVIMDFGLAQRRNARGPLNEQLFGTPAYMAPELWKGVRPSVTSDIYAMGVILWELVSGQSPSDLRATSATLDWDDRPAWKPPKGYGKWDRVIGKCLEADPARRYQNAEELGAAVGPKIRKRWLLTATMAVAVAVASGVVTYQRATLPAQAVRLAVLPFSSEVGDKGISEVLFRDTAGELGKITGNEKTSYKFLMGGSGERINTAEKARSVLGATEVLRGVIERQGDGGIKIRAYVTDVRTGADATEWDASYRPEEIRYAAGALKGVVTGTLHLPNGGEGAIKAEAKSEYLQGLLEATHETGVDHALTLFEKAATKDSSSALTYAGLAQAKWLKYYATSQQSWLDGAAESLRQAQKRNPDLPQVHCVAGVLKATAGRYEQAIAEYERAIELEARDSDAYRGLGDAYEENNQLPEAKAAYLKAVEVDPAQYKNYRRLGYFHYQRAEYDVAAEHFRRAVGLAPREPLMHYELAITLILLGTFSEAERELRLSIGLHETGVALHNLGLVLMYQSKDKEAVPLIERAVKLTAGRHLWWMNLGTAYRRTGQAKQSREAYKHGLVLAEEELARNPRGGKVRAHLAYLCARLGDRQRAESEVAQAMQETPNDSDTRWMAAATYEALHRRENALTVLEGSPAGMISDLSRWPDLADLAKDSRFLKLLATHSEK